MQSKIGRPPDETSGFEGFWGDLKGSAGRFSKKSPLLGIFVKNGAGGPEHL
jgi:hypothetical protein